MRTRICYAPLILRPPKVLTLSVSAREEQHVFSIEADGHTDMEEQMRIESDIDIYTFVEI